MTYEHLLTEVDDDKICWITLNRPECINAFNTRLCQEMSQALEAADRDDNVHVVVLRGAGKGFSSGHDLKEDADDDFPSAYAYRNHYLQQQHEFTAPWRISKPVIASAHYCAIGKGFEIATLCDITIVTDDCRLGYKEMRYGISGFHMILPWLVNMKTARDLMLTGRELDAREAKDLGLVTEVVKPDELAAATLKKARLVAALPNEMQRIHKHYVNHVYDLMGHSSAVNWYNDLMTMMSFCPTELYQKFSEITLEKGLKTALAETNARYNGLD
ncbi:MAG: enoyl-CoA hydratase/isomerase family protein [Gammaproteobacteria bacterium]|nr:enoyl-CoA hydratase/isomerase family protein [Gammaproteobacteria bacterium]MDH3536551.1 enoyl-CoA hydratase/isomerase family protein [Gammaproteobacteria bacterium]